MGGWVDAWVDTWMGGDDSTQPNPTKPNLTRPDPTRLKPVSSPASSPPTTTLAPSPTTTLAPSPTTTLATPPHPHPPPPPAYRWHGESGRLNPHVVRLGFRTLTLAFRIGRRAATVCGHCTSMRPPHAPTACHHLPPTTSRPTIESNMPALHAFFRFGSWNWITATPLFTV